VWWHKKEQKEIVMGWMMLMLMLILMVGAVLVYLFSLPKGYTVTRSMVIAKPVHEVFDFIVDFNHWHRWSPWLLQEPTAATATTNGAEVGGTHAWDGLKIGAGQMQHRVIIPNERIEMLLTFIRPFKAQSEVVWRVKNVMDKGVAATELTWSMQAKMPLPFRPFQSMVARMIGYDFDLGLAMLRGQLDPTSEHPTLVFEGVQERVAQVYVTEHFEGTLDAMRSAMYEAYPRLWNTIAADAERWEQKPTIAAYHRVNLSKQSTVMDMGFAVTSVKAGETSLTLPAGRYFVMRMNGGYQFLPSAWNTIYGQIKMQKLKINKRQPALEVYTLNPMEASHSNDWVTHLCVPLK
jgi:predicted transcriptional regulator YdeE